MNENDDKKPESEDKEKSEKKRDSSKLWTPYSDPNDAHTGERQSGETMYQTDEGEISEEELRRRIEEAMEKITVADIVLDFIISMASLAYQRMGMPKDVNEKYKDMEQARLAIDCIDALMGTLEEKVPKEKLDPLVGTLDNLKVNFVKES